MHNEIEMGTLGIYVIQQVMQFWGINTICMINQKKRFSANLKKYIHHENENTLHLNSG